MSKLILFMMITLDGFFEGPGGDIDWHNVDEEFNEFAVDQLNSAGGLLFGRVTYQGMASYWPTQAAQSNDPEVAAKMNALPKFVFSRTLDQAGWANTTLVKADVAGAVSRLKQQSGKNLLILGSSDLAASFAGLGLIDEYRIIINPVVLGEGRSWLQGIHQRLDLKLVDTRRFRSGNILLSYHPR